MEVLADLLYSAKGEIIAGIFFALLGWVYSRFRKLTRLYKRQKQELERMTSEMQHLGATKQEFERLQEALRQAEAQHQEDEQRITELQNQLEREHERMQAELNHKSEAQEREYEQRISELQNQLEREHERMQAELQRKEESLKQAEAQKAEEARQRAEVQRQLEVLKKNHPPMSDYDFIELCKSGDAGKVEEALMFVADVNAKDKYGYTALMRAASNGHTGVAELLLKHGADVNATNNTTDSTALMYAVASGHADVAELLIKHGADVNAKNHFGFTALGFATAPLSYHPEIAELLCEYGAKE